MEFTYRIAGRDDRDAYIDFINYVFSQAHRPHDFKALLPKEYGDGRESRAAHFLATTGDGRIRGVTAALPFDMDIADRRLKCAYVGSVSVHPYARGEGHMKRLMALTEEWMVSHQVDIAVLGGLRQRYQYFGYTKGGVSIRYRFNADNARHGLRDVQADDLVLSEITDASDARLDALCALHDGRPVRIARERKRFLDICHSWYNRLYAVQRGAECAGYLIADDDHSISEFAMGDPKDYPGALKAWMRATGARSISIGVQPWERELMAFLDATAESCSMSEAENLRVFHWENALPALLAQRQMIRPLSDGDFCAVIDDRPLHVSVRDGHIAVDGRAPDDAPKYAGLALQEEVFRPSALLRPTCAGGAPMDWFPLPLSIPDPDGF